MLDLDTSATNDAGSVAVLDRVDVHQSIRWHAHGHVDVFTLDQIAACASQLEHESYGVYAARLVAAKQTPRPQHVWLLDRANHAEPIGAELLAFCAPDDFADVSGNLVTNLGLTRLGKCLFGLSSYSTIDGTTRGRIGVGDTATAATTADTDLGAAAGSTHRQFARLDSIPTVTNGSWVLVATHATGVSNFAWNEWAIDGGIAAGTTVTSDTASTPGLFNHRIPGSTLITKSASSSAVFTATLTVS